MRIKYALGGMGVRSELRKHGREPDIMGGSERHEGGCLPGAQREPACRPDADTLLFLDHGVKSAPLGMEQRRDNLEDCGRKAQRMRKGD
jgi:hypothetical protein